MSNASQPSLVNKKIEYVLSVVLDDTTGFVVGLTKKRGPAFLLNKITFPGGKIEEGESGPTAASREVLEETGLKIPEKAWTLIHVREDEESRVQMFAATSGDVLFAKTMETEPVAPLRIKSHLALAAAHPASYAPDFIETLTRAMAATGHCSRAQADYH